MADSVHSTNLLPVSDYKIAGEVEPLPFSSIPANNQSGAQQSQTSKAARQDQFETYLNRHAIMALKRHQNERFDTVAEILSKSVYKPIGDGPNV